MLKTLSYMLQLQPRLQIMEITCSQWASLIKWWLMTTMHPKGQKEKKSLMWLSSLFHGQSWSFNVVSTSLASDHQPLSFIDLRIILGVSAPCSLPADWFAKILSETEINDCLWWFKDCTGIIKTSLIATFLSTDLNTYSSSLEGKPL